MFNHIIIPAAGEGVRFGANIPKALINVYGKPIIQWQLEAIPKNKNICISIVVGFKGDDVANFVNSLNFSNVRILQNLNYKKTSVVNFVSVFKHHLSNINFICTDLRQYVPNKNKFDLIIIFGVTQFLCDQDVLNLYKKIKSQLKNGGTLLVKHQISTLENDKIIDDFSVKLNCKYASIFRTMCNDSKLLEESGFEIITVCDPYPKSFNKWDDSCFKLYECKIPILKG